MKGWTESDARELYASINTVRMLAWMRRLVSDSTTSQQTYVIKWSGAHNVEHTAILMIQDNLLFHCEILWRMYCGEVVDMKPFCTSRHGENFPSLRSGWIITRKGNSVYDWSSGGRYGEISLSVDRYFSKAPQRLARKMDRNYAGLEQRFLCDLFAFGR